MHHIYHALFSAIAAHNAAPAHSTAHAVTPRNTPSGAFTLQEGRAITLQPQAVALLRVRQGGAWVTLPRLPGDHFLQDGEALQVQPGDCLVMEPWHGRVHTPVHAHAGVHVSATTEALYFDWDPVPMQVTAPAVVAPRGSRWSAPAWSAPRPSYCAAVRAPLADLRAALVLGAGAARRLAAGFAVWGLGGVLTLGAGLAARARTAHASASAAHGRMASGESMASSGAL